MDLIEEIKLEFNGIRDTIYEYTDKGDIKNYLTNLKKALEENHIDRIKYSINKVFLWYSANLSKILSNSYVFNGETHKSYFAMLDRYNTELDNYEPKTHQKPDSTSEYQNKIFLSHSSADKEIGEALMDLLINLGVKKEDIFYSSQYHTGVPLGVDFHSKIKENLKNNKITIFLLTEDFYRSEYCLNEMGAVWVLDKKYIPFLLDDLEVKDMKGFIDDRYIALEPKLEQLGNLFFYLEEHYGLSETKIDHDVCFQRFCDIVKKVIDKKPKYKVKKDMSETDKIILKTPFTDNELFLLSYFKDYQTDFFNENDPNDIEFNEWIKVSDINLEKTKNLLNNFHWFRILRNQEEYDGCKLDHVFFRDLLDLSFEANEKLEKTKKKKEKTLQVSTEPNIPNKLNIDIEKTIIEGNLSKEELLLIAYMSETGTYLLGDRWMANEQIEKIQEWEKKENLNNTLSDNYLKALNKFKIRNFLVVESTTSYGNPRQFRVIENISNVMLDFSGEVKTILSREKLNNSEIKELKYDYDFEIPDDEMR